jgi:phospholipid/cholesterol/gamma-HCH transport system substrate-binding protein
MRRIGIVVLIAALISAGCSGQGSDTIEVTASFTDVGDLAEMAPVMMADIPVGKVTDIRLVDNQALVTMSLEKKADVPRGVTARVRRTSVLGERMIDLVPPEDMSARTPALTTGSEITNTEVRSDLEDLVAEGSPILGAVSATDLATMIDEGARGFGDQGDDLRLLLGNYRKIIGAYAGRSDQIGRLISNMAEFNHTVAAEADAHARAIANTQRSIEVLDEESQRLIDAIVSLNRLAKGSSSLLNAHVDEMEAFFKQMRIILSTLKGQERSIELLLRWAPGHNQNTQLVEYKEFNQVYQDFVICGLNDNPNDPARRCKGGH